MNRTAVLGVGNPLSEKDSVGIAVAERVAEVTGWELVLSHTTGLEVVDILFPFDRAVAIDTVIGLEMGEVVIVSEPAAKAQRFSHSLGLLESLKVGRAVYGEEFPDVVVVGVGVRGHQMTLDVNKIAKKIIAIVEGYRER
ncbi:MAG: hydrogenase maturation protease [Archaeoglobi archaeon]|nr:hydrogenase maturation protease [Archaeoglobi archaeon]